VSEGSAKGYPRLWADEAASGGNFRKRRRRRTPKFPTIFCVQEGGKGREGGVLDLLALLAGSSGSGWHSTWAESRTPQAFLLLAVPFRASQIFFRSPAQALASLARSVKSLRPSVSSHTRPFSLPSLALHLVVSFPPPPPLLLSSLPLHLTPISRHLLLLILLLSTPRHRTPLEGNTTLRLRN